MKRADLAARLRATFLTELEEQVRGMNADLLALEGDPSAEAHLKSLFRAAHTLKGASRAAGFPMVEEVCHALEGLLAKAREGTVALGPDEFDVLFAAADALAEAGDRLRSGASLVDSPLDELRTSLAGAGPAAPRRNGPRRAESPQAAPSTGPDAERSTREPPRPPGPSRETPSPPPPAATAPERGDTAPAVAAELRVPAEKLDSLVAAVGELRTTASRLDMRPLDVQALQELAETVADRAGRIVHPLRHALGDGGGDDPPELTELNALVADARGLATRAARVIRAMRSDARVVGRLTDDLRQQVKTIRMRPFSDACEAVPRVVRDLASAAGKKVRLEIEGEDVEADREVLRAVGEALLHLVPNAVDHGIEPPDVRRRAGKPETGTLRLAASVRGDRLLVTVSDDGAGLNVPALRARLEALGARVPDDDAEVVRLVFRGGVSTRTAASMTSGRGVGLDSVRHAMERARGTVRADWLPGEGTRFTLECPLTLIGVRAILARVGSQEFALPTAAIRRILRVRPDQVRRAEGRDLVQTDDGPVRLVSLARLLGPPLAGEPISGPFPAVVLSSGGRTAAVMVDELLQDHELLVRPVRRVRNPPPYLAGAAILPSGRVSLVLNAAAIVDAALEDRAHPRIVAPAEPGGDGRGTLLVVDDSITTRTLEHSILQAAGYDVLTAVDGAEAWRILQDHRCDLVVSDVEMPRMDGFALCEAIRASRRLHALPVVLVTALESSEQRARGMEAGADAYLPKSSFDEDELLETIRQLIG